MWKRLNILTGIIVSAVIIVGVAGILYLYNRAHRTNLGAFTGIVQADGCAEPPSPGPGIAPLPIGDVGCSITVSGKQIYIVHGNVLTKSWGEVEGFTTDQNIIGKKVEVKANKRGSSYDISGTADYVKLLN